MIKCFGSAAQRGMLPAVVMWLLHGPEALD
jgi:hypothetical protein